MKKIYFAAFSKLVIRNGLEAPSKSYWPFISCKIWKSCLLKLKDEGKLLRNREEVLR